MQIHTTTPTGRSSKPKVIVLYRRMSGSLSLTAPKSSQSVLNMTFETHLDGVSVTISADEVRRLFRELCKMEETAATLSPFDKAYHNLSDWTDWPST